MWKGKLDAYKELLLSRLETNWFGFLYWNATDWVFIMSNNVLD
jgi:hypothetical protein